MAIAAKGDHDDVVSEINVTPLVDVMLVLLVVFIVTAPLLANVVKVNLPKTATTQPPETKKPITVSVDVAGKVYVDREETALPSLEPKLRSLSLSQPDVAVHLEADQGVPYGTVAKVMSAIDRAGVAKLSVITANE